MTERPSFALPSHLPVPPTGSDSRTFPIHCVVEQEDDCTDCPSTTRCICDMYVVLPGSTLLRDLIHAALAQLSFPTADTISTTASGSIQFRNWKPLPFSVITDDHNQSIEQLFCDVFTAVTLRIRLNKRIGVWTDEKVRAAIVKLLREHTQSELALVSPLSQPTISNIANSRYRASLSEETCRAFGEWYDSFEHQNQGFDSLNGTGAKQRLTYHPIYELPLMREWFRLCPNPTREDLERFTEQLNTTPTRKERVLVSPSRLRIWWINEKQRMRRCTDPGITSRVGRKRLRRKWNESGEPNDETPMGANVIPQQQQQGHSNASKSFTLLQ